MDEWIPPDKITVPTPLLLSRKRGLYAKKADDFPTSVRMTPHDKLLIEAEARELGIGFSTFVRWCALQCARELALHRTGTKPKADF